MKRLFEVHLSKGDNAKCTTLYVVATTETEASALAIKQVRDWGYGDWWMKDMGVVAQEGQYGKPFTLLIQ